MSNSIKRKAIPIATMVMAIVMMGPAVLSTAFAVPPTNVERTGGLHFVGTPDVTRTADNRLVVTGEVAGAGRTATATLTGDAIVTQGCVNRGGNEPRGLQTTTEDIAVTDTFNTRQGRGTFDLQFEATGDPNFECPSRNMQEVVVDVAFTNLVLTVTSQTGTIVTELPDQ